MVIEQKRLFFSTLRVILDDEKLRMALQEKRYSYISGVSYQHFHFGEDMRVKEKKTAVIDLNDNFDAIFAKFHDTTRNEIHRTYRMPDLAIVVEDKNISALFSLHKKFERKQSRHPLSFFSFSASTFFSAYYKGELIASVACYHDEHYTRVRAIFSLRLFEKDKEKYRIIAYAARRLIWEACQYGKRKGNTIFDLGAINLTDPKKKPITDFKSGFGGKIVDEYTYTYESPLFHFLKRLIFR